MAAELLLRCDGLTKTYGGVVALDSASLEVRAGEIRGLVGANGAGKSTLVKILTGITRPTNGTVCVQGRLLALGRPKESLRAGIASVPQELTVAPTMTVAENILLGHEPRGRLGRLLRRVAVRETGELLVALSLDIDPTELVGRLPLIEQRLVVIARALSRDARLVIFDEPTATVSPLEVELLLQTIAALAGRGVAVLYVSHHLGEVESICHSATVLRNGRVTADLSGAEAHRQALIDLLASPGESVQDEVRRRVSDEVVFAARGVSGERLRGVDISARAGEVVGLAGLAGSGARELLLTVVGAVPFEGAIEVGGRRLTSGSTVTAVAAGVGFLAGDRSIGTFPAHSVRYNVSLSSLPRHALGPFVRPNSERSMVAQVLDQVALRVSQVAPISSLSGGNQQKALVGRWIASGSKLLLLDDPTAGVDVMTRPEIHRQILALCEAGAAVLLVSTDVDEFVALCDRVLVFERGAVTEELGSAELTPARLLAAMTRHSEQIKLATQ